MPPRNKKKNYKRKRRNYNKGNNKRVVARIPQYRNLAPNNLLLRDTYQTQIKLVPAGTVRGLSHYPHVCFFRASSGHNIFNPVNTARGAFTQLAGTLGDLQSLQSASPMAYRSMYSHYYVLGAKMVVSFQPTANPNGSTLLMENNVQVGCGLARDMAWPTSGAASGSSLNSLTQAKNATTRQIIANDSATAGKYGRCRLWSGYSPKHALGIKDTTDNEDLKVSVLDGNANESTFFYITLTGLNAGGATDPEQIVPYIINVKIDYTLKFVEPNESKNEPLP